jgi:hypothetical protein
MVRRARVEIEGGLYHVYNRIASGEPVFSDPGAAVEFIEVIPETRTRARKMLVMLGVERWRQGRTGRARVLQKNPDVVSWWAGEGTKSRISDAEYAAELDNVDQGVAALAAEMNAPERLGQTF